MSTRYYCRLSSRNNPYIYFATLIAQLEQSHLIYRMASTRQKFQCPWEDCALLFAIESDCRRHYNFVHLQYRYHCHFQGCKDNHGQGFRTNTSRSFLLAPYSLEYHEWLYHEVDSNISPAQAKFFTDFAASKESKGLFQRILRLL